MPSRDPATGRRLPGSSQRHQAGERAESFIAALADLRADRGQEGKGTPLSRLLERIARCNTLLDAATAAGHTASALQALRLLDSLEKQRTKREIEEERSSSEFYP